MLDEEGTTIDDFPDFKPAYGNVVDALSDLTAFLKGEKTKETSYYVYRIS